MEAWCGYMSKYNVYLIFQPNVTYFPQPTEQNMVNVLLNVHYRIFFEGFFVPCKKLFIWDLTFVCKVTFNLKKKKFVTCTYHVKRMKIKKRRKLLKYLCTRTYQCWVYHVISTSITKPWKPHNIHFPVKSFVTQSIMHVCSFMWAKKKCWKSTQAE